MSTILALRVDLFVAKGELKFYLKNKTELWINLSIKIIFDGNYSGDYKIMSF